jgi:hypothetical protein
MTARSEDSGASARSAEFGVIYMERKERPAFTLCPVYVVPARRYPAEPARPAREEIELLELGSRP